MKRLDPLRSWADIATTLELAAIKSARCRDVAWLIGSSLPAIESSERFWGERVFVPIGFRTEPNWPESAIREAAGVAPEEFLALMPGRAEAVRSDAFRPLTRGAIRRALFTASGEQS
jgi:hypothetical protein